MFNPKEAQEDGFILGAVIALLIAAGAFILINISFDNGFRFGLLLQNQTETTGTITGYAKTPAGGDVVRFKFEDAQGIVHTGEKLLLTGDASGETGGPIEVVYNQDYPEYYLFPGRVDGARYDFFMTSGLILVIVLCFLYIVYQFVGYVRFKRKMTYY